MTCQAVIVRSSEGLLCVRTPCTVTVRLPLGVFKPDQALHGVCSTVRRVVVLSVQKDRKLTLTEFQSIAPAASVNRI